MRQPRIMKNPNGGILNVDVTLLQLGLSQCEKIAKVAVKEDDAGVQKRALMDICEVVRRTLRDMGDEKMEDEVGEILREEVGADGGDK